MVTVVMVHVNTILFNLSFSPREAGQLKPDSNSAERVKMRLYSRRLIRLLCLCVMRILCSKRTGCR